MGSCVPLVVVFHRVHLWQVVRLSGLSSLSWRVLCLQSWHIFKQSWQKVAKMNFYLARLVFSRENRIPKRAKFKIYLSFEGCRASVVALSLGRWSCPLGANMQGFRWSFVVCSVPLSLCCFCFPAMPAKYALFRVLGAFLAGFGALVWVCVALVLCVDCGAFYARV